MAMAAPGDAPKQQKLRMKIMFKGATLVEITAPARPVADPAVAGEAVWPGHSLKPLKTAASGASRIQQEQSGLPAALVNYISRQPECMSPLGNWVDDTLVMGRAAADECAEASPPLQQLAAPPAQLSLPHVVQASGKEQHKEELPWWDDQATPGGRSSEGCSTREDALDAPSPGSVSNGCAPGPRMDCYRPPAETAASATSHPAFSHAPAAPAASAQPPRQRPQEKPRPQVDQRQPAAAQPPQHQPAQQPLPQPTQRPQAPKLQPRLQPPRPRPLAKAVDWLAAEATPINAAPRREASPAAQRLVKADSSAAPASPARLLAACAASPAPHPGVRHSSSGPQLHQAAKVQPGAQAQPGAKAARSASPAPAAGKAAGKTAGAKRKGAPEVKPGLAAKRAFPSPAPSPRPGSVQGGRPAAAGGAGRPQARPATPPASGAAKRPAAPGSRLNPAAAAARGGGAAAQLSGAAAAGEPVGGFGGGQWNGFREGQVVWAKMAGFPAWPAQVQAPSPEALRCRESGLLRPVFVVFFGTQDFQWLAAGKLSRFGDSYKARARPRDAQLQQALDAAWWTLGKPKPAV